MLNLTAQIIFWASVAALVYTYAGYPLLVWAVSRLRPLAYKKQNVEPTVSFIIAAYNEERALREKLENTLQLDYPKEKLEIIVASDGSTDATDKIALEFAARGVKLFRQEGRAGKTVTQNGAVNVASGEIIVFSDATTFYKENIVRALVRNFADERIGCVAGKLIYVSPDDSGVGEGARSYWNYETFIKTAESRACSLIGVSGCLYAVRRKNYVPMYPEACSDFLIATKIFEQGLRTVYEPEAVSFEETNVRTDKELKMRVRVITQTYTDLWRHAHMLNPFRSGFFAVELFSHKVLRYSVPFFLISLLATSAVLSFSSILFKIFLILQIGFYLLAIIGLILERLGVSTRILALPHYFVLANLAAVLAVYKFSRGERFAAWQPIRDGETRRQGESEKKTLNQTF